MGYGWYKLVPGLREKMEYQREKNWARIHLTPLLTAEEDRDQARRYFADQAREKELLGSQSSAYNSDRYVSLSAGCDWGRIRTEGHMGMRLGGALTRY
jgi:NADH dehydrogenase (ubiquinone) 1 alpha subcomplex subunit 13